MCYITLEWAITEHNDLFTSCSIQDRNNSRFSFSVQKCLSALDNAVNKASADCWMRLEILDDSMIFSMSIQVTYTICELFSRPICDGSKIRSCADVPPLSRTSTTGPPSPHSEGCIGEGLWGEGNWGRNISWLLFWRVYRSQYAFCLRASLRKEVGDREKVYHMNLQMGM